MSVAAHVWRRAMDKPYVVRATIGRVVNEIAGQHAAQEDAIEQARQLPGGTVVHAVSGRKVWPEGDSLE